MFVVFGMLFVGTLFFGGEEKLKKIQIIYASPVDIKQQSVDDMESFDGVVEGIDGFLTNGFRAGSSILNRHPDYTLFNISCYPHFTNYSDPLYFSQTSGKNYSKCVMATSAVIDIKNSSITIKCNKSIYNTYFIDDTNKEIFGLNDIDIAWKSFIEQTEINTQNGQFLIIRCAKNEIYPFVFNRFNHHISKKSMERVENIEKRFNVSITRPLTVYLLMFDSLSRQNFYRSMKDTVNYLQSNIVEGKYKDKFNVFDFKLSNILGLNTNPNIFPILYGRSYASLKNELAKLNPKNLTLNPAYIQLQKKYSIWHHYSKLGYITLFSYDTTYDFVSKITGKTILTDFQFLNFWNMGKRVFGYNDFLDRQRCFGAKDAHWFSLNYNKQFISNYRNNKKFIYSHLSPGHESSGVITTADKDLAEHIDEVLSMFSSVDEDIIIFIMSDHGRVQGKLEFDLEHFVEQRLPLTLLISNSEFLSRTGAYHALENNSKRLISRYDLYLTLKSLSYSPFGNLTSKDYEAFKNQLEVPGGKNLFNEFIQDRSCEEIGSRAVDCICKSPKPTDLNNELQLIILQIVSELTSSAINIYFSRRLRTHKVFSLNLKNSQVFEIRSEEEGGSAKYWAEFLYSDQDGNEDTVKTQTHFARLTRFVETRSKIEDASGMKPSEIFKFNETDYQVQVISIEFDYLKF